jgi:hypothetical protein
MCMCTKYFRRISCTKTPNGLEYVTAHIQCTRVMLFLFFNEHFLLVMHPMGFKPKSSPSIPLLLEEGVPFELELIGFVEIFVIIKKICSDIIRY